MSPTDINRRSFLKNSSAAAAALYLNLPHKLFGDSEKKVRVVLIRHKKLLDDVNRPHQELVQEMLDQAVMTLLNEKDVVQAWKRIIQPNDVVGIKTNVWRYLPTTSQVENAIKKQVLDAGVPEKNIGIRDRGLLRDPIFTRATALINARPLRTHHWSGVGTMLKNYITFVNRPSAYHPDSCADLAKLWFLPETKGKTRLNVMVLFTPQFHGVGPHSFSPHYTWPYQGLMVGFDPVAMDAIGVRLLMEKRKLFFKEDRPLNPPPKHVFLADTRHKLGVADPEKIELIKLGWQEGSLI
ncbi:MAG TPA: DUF362 domain-containing protein [bacterium]|nr:DUF362 domain-containing protein [bacterium]